MTRAALILAVVLAAAPAAAQEEDASTPGLLEIGGKVGTQLGLGGYTPGGLRFAGVFLYRMAEETWFDGELGFTFGSSDRACIPDPVFQLGRSCSHGAFDGFSTQLRLGARYPFWELEGGVVPYVRGGVGIDFVNFAGDDVGGFALPLWAGGGGRWRVSEIVTIGGDAFLSFGPAFFGEDVGTKGVFALGVQVGAEIRLQ